MLQLQLTDNALGDHHTLGLIDNFAKFESSLLSFDSVRLESSFNIIKNSKMLICLFN